ncbi:MAG: cation transporter [Chitinophagaceae bacterium]
MKTIDLTIPNMQSKHCQTRVSNALSQLEGAQIQQIQAGKLTVQIATDTIEKVVVEVVQKAGYTVENSKLNTEVSCSAACCVH